jgi:hypothetical protein
MIHISFSSVRIGSISNDHAANHGILLHDAREQSSMY